MTSFLAWSNNPNHILLLNWQSLCGLYGSSVMTRTGMNQMYQPHLISLLLIIFLQNRRMPKDQPIYSKLWPHTHQNVWSPPPNGYIKCNLDAAIFKDTQSFGIGIYLHGRHNNFLKAASSFFSGILKPAVAESWAMLNAIQWTSQLRYQNIIFQRLRLF